MKQRLEDQLRKVEQARSKLGAASSRIGMRALGDEPFAQADTLIAYDYGKSAEDRRWADKLLAYCARSGSEALLQPVSGGWLRSKGNKWEHTPETLAESQWTGGFKTLDKWSEALSGALRELAEEQRLGLRDMCNFSVAVGMGKGSSAFGREQARMDAFGVWPAGFRAEEGMLRLLLEFEQELAGMAGEGLCSRAARSRGQPLSDWPGNAPARFWNMLGKALGRRCIPSDLPGWVWHSCAYFDMDEPAAEASAVEDRLMAALVAAAGRSGMEALRFGAHSGPRSLKEQRSFLGQAAKDFAPWRERDALDSAAMAGKAPGRPAGRI